MGIALIYRPKTFGEVHGQPSTVEVFRAIIKTGRYPAAVLLSGTRGTGKTSLARIYARALNCEHRTEDGDPCNQCTSCKGILDKSFTWVIEIDAASNRGIDDIRSLAEKLRHAPPDGRRFVWIIDECHQLTGEAANAFLKILEEPPPYVNFILCTTEEGKLIDTIKSRCMRFTFKHVCESDLIKVLKGILAKEKVDYEEDALKIIARYAKGSIRDALTLIEPVVVSNTKITVEEVNKVCSVVDTFQIASLVDSMIEFNLSEVFDKTSKLFSLGIDSRIIFEILGRYFHDLGYIVFKVPHLVLEPDSVLVRMEEQTKKLGQKGVILLIELWADKVQWIQYSDMFISLVPIILTKYLQEYLSFEQSHQVITKFIEGYEGKVSLISFGSTCSSIKIQQNLVNIVRFPLDAIDDYYILFSDVVRLGNLKYVKNEIRRRKL